MPAAIPEPIASLVAHYRDALRGTTLEIVAEGRTSEKIGELTRTASAYADRETAAWRDSPGSLKIIACRDGCTSCCHVPVAVSIPEAILIGNDLIDGDPGHFVHVRDRIAHHPSGRPGPLGPRQERVGHPCPLLVDGGCSIYEVRPLMCRGWTSPDASLCADALEVELASGDRLPIPNDAVRRAIHLGIGQGVRSGLVSLGIESGLVDLVAALRIVLDDTTAVDRWLRGEPAFRDAEVVEYR